MFQNVTPHTQFITLDEYTVPHLKAQKLNLLCDGASPIPVKGGQAITPKKPVVIVCGNKHPQDLYPNAWKFIEARFNVHNVDDVSKDVVPYMFTK